MTEKHNADIIEFNSNRMMAGRIFTEMLSAVNDVDLRDFIKFFKDSIIDFIITPPKERRSLKSFMSNEGSVFSREDREIQDRQVFENFMSECLKKYDEWSRPKSSKDEGGDVLPIKKEE